MKILSATPQQIKWADKAWDYIWDQPSHVGKLKMISQKALHEFFLRKMTPDEFKCFHNEFGKYRIPIDIHFGDKTITWVTAADFLWNQDEQSWTVINGHTNAKYTIVKS